MLCGKNLQKNQAKRLGGGGCTGPGSALNGIVFVCVKKILQRAEKQHTNEQNHMHVDIENCNVACWQNLVLHVKILLSSQILM